MTLPTALSMAAPLAFTKTGVRTVLDPEVMVVLAAEKEVIATAEPTVTVVVAVTGSPAAFVTVRVKVVLEARAPVLAATPLPTLPMPWSMFPVPPEKTAVRRLPPPVTTDDGLAPKEVMLAGGTTVTVTVRVRGPPRPLAVRV